MIKIIDTYKMMNEELSLFHTYACTKRDHVWPDRLTTEKRKFKMLAVGQDTTPSMAKILLLQWPRYYSFNGQDSSEIVMTTGSFTLASVTVHMPAPWWAPISEASSPIASTSRGTLKQPIQFSKVNTRYDQKHFIKQASTSRPLLSL
jgi:hypothetical protein